MLREHGVVGISTSRALMHNVFTVMGAEFYAFTAHRQCQFGTFARDILVL